MREAPPAPAGPTQLCVSADGALVPLSSGEWAAVKTLVIAEVQPPLLSNGAAVIRTHQPSYFSRLTDADPFQRLALVETHRRGVEHATAVGAVRDGAAWLQKFLDHHGYHAIRRLDFPHAGEAQPCRRASAVGRRRTGARRNAIH
jgi:hypothetical protein